MRSKILRSLLTFVAGVLFGAAITATAAKTDKTANELSLRVTGHRGHRVVGTLMVKENGEWREVELASQNTLAK
jgi:hypothetical protein